MDGHVQEFPKKKSFLEFQCSGCLGNVSCLMDSRCLIDGTQLKCPICGLINIINIGGMKEETEDG